MEFSENRESEVDLRVLHSNDGTNLAMQLICKTRGLKYSSKRSGLGVFWK